MEYVPLGRTGLKVSRLCLGCMSFGLPERGADSWTLDEEGSGELVRAALDEGINFFDTANVYSDGTSEEILGRLVRRLTDREQLVIASKVFGPMSAGPNAQGLSRKTIITEVEASLRRLEMDYLDVLYIHRWDPSTPVEETIDAIDSLISSGKVRYAGASSMFAWQFCKLLFSADLQGARRFVVMQNHYNLLHREEEREMMQLCADQEIAVVPWSPLARGRLARDPSLDDTDRTSDDSFGDSLYGMNDEAEATIRHRVAEVAASHEVPMAAVSLAWLLAKGVVAPIVGATKVDQVLEQVQALDVRLSPDEIASLEAPYQPCRPVGFE